MIDQGSFHLNDLKVTRVFNEGLVDYHKVYLLRSVESQVTHPPLILGGLPVVAFFSFVPIYDCPPDIDALLKAEASFPVLSVLGFTFDNEGFFHSLEFDSHKLLYSQVSNELASRDVRFNEDS